MWGRTTFKTKDGLGTDYQSVCDIQAYRYPEPDKDRFRKGVTAFIPASDNVNATHLTLLSMMLTGTWEEIEHLILMDNGSTRGHNFEVMKKFVDLRKEGLVLRVNPNVDHKGALDLLYGLGILDTEYLNILDSDLEFLRSGVIGAMKENLVDESVYGTGLVIPDRYFRSRGMFTHWDEREWFSCETILCSCCLWRSSVWKEVMGEVGAGGWWIPEKNVFYDGMSQANELAVKKGHKRVNFVFNTFVMHYGCITWARRKTNKEFDQYDLRYKVMTEKLRQWGVPENELHDDPWTGAGWAGMNAPEEVPASDAYEK